MTYDRRYKAVDSGYVFNRVLHILLNGYEWLWMEDKKKCNDEDIKKY